MRALPLTLGTVLLASGLLACGRVKLPANWGSGLDASINLDGGGSFDLPVVPDGAAPDLLGPCAQCSLNATCNEAQMPNPCMCKPGFVGPGQTCTDIDECTLSADDCDTEANCQNTIGGFTCTCKPGFRPTGTMMGKAGECKQNWLPKTIIDEPPVDMAPSGQPNATAENTRPSSSGVAIGSGNKIYLAPSGNVCNNGTFYWRGFDTTTGQLSTESNQVISSDICYEMSGNYGNRPVVGSDGAIYSLGYYYVRFNPATKTFFADSMNGGGTWNYTALFFTDGGPYVLSSRGAAVVGDYLYYYGGANGSGTKQKLTHRVLLSTAVPTVEAGPDLPLPLNNLAATPAGTSVYMMFGDKDGDQTVSTARITRHDTANNTIDPSTEPAWSALPVVTVPNNVDRYSPKANNSVDYQSKKWFVVRDFQGGSDLLRLWAFDPVTSTFSGGVVLPASLGTQEYEVRLAATTGSTPRLYVVGKGASVMEIYQYNE